MTYASTTDVPADRSRAEIERTLERYGSTGFAYGTEIGRAMIAFQAGGRRIRFILPLADQVARNEKQHAQFIRTRWRCLLLAIKSKLESVESGIETFDEAFMPHIVMPNGQTMAEHALPYVKEAYSTGKMPPLLTFTP